MKGFWWRMRERIGRWMYGRYGNDKLNRFLLILSLILLILAYIPHMGLLVFASIGLMIWSYFRCFSRNIVKRQREEAAFLGFWRGIGRRISLRRRIFRERKTHRYFKCPSCKAMLRVPKGKGKLDVTCPRCKTVTVKKS